MTDGSRFPSIPSLFAISDEQAMWRVQTQDDPQAFARLVKRWEKPIQRLCARMLADAHRAEDMTQETFARLFACRKNYQPTARFSTFLWRIALNLCYDELRRIKRRAEARLENEPLEAVSPFSPGPASLPSPDAQLMDFERAQIVRQAVRQLPEAYRAVLILRHYENLKFREIADVLEIPEGTVKSRMAEALTQLSRLLKPRLEQNKSGFSETDHPIQERIFL